MMPARGKRSAEHEARLKVERERRLRKRMEEAAAAADAELGAHDPLIELLINEQRSGRSYFTGLDRNLLTVVLGGYLVGTAKRGVVPQFGTRAVVKPTVRAPLVRYGYANPQDFCLARGEQPGTWHVLRSTTGEVFTYSRDQAAWSRHGARFPPTASSGASYPHFVGLQARDGELYAWRHTSGERVHCLKGVVGTDAVNCPSRSLLAQQYIFCLFFDHHGRGYTVNCNVDDESRRFWLNREGMPSVVMTLARLSWDRAALYPRTDPFSLRSVCAGATLDRAEHVWLFMRVGPRYTDEKEQRLLAYEFNAVDGKLLATHVLPETRWVDARADKFAFDARGHLCALDNKGHLAVYTLSPPTLVQQCTLSCSGLNFEKQALNFDDGALVQLGTSHTATLFMYM